MKQNIRLIFAKILRILSLVIGIINCYISLMFSVSIMNCFINQDTTHNANVSVFILEGITTAIGLLSGIFACINTYKCCGDIYGGKKIHIVGIVLNILLPIVAGISGCIMGNIFVNIQNIF